MTTREQQLERALRTIRDYTEDNNIFEAIGAALAAPQSAEPVAQKPVAEFHAREGVLKWHDYNYMASLAGTDRVIQLYTAPPTDTLRDACKELVKEWREFAARHALRRPNFVDTTYVMGKRARMDADELERLLAQHAPKGG